MREDGGGGTLSQSDSVELAVRGVVVRKMILKPIEKYLAIMVA